MDLSGKMNLSEKELEEIAQMVKSALLSGNYHEVETILNDQSLFTESFQYDSMGDYSLDMVFDSEMFVDVAKICSMVKNSLNEMGMDVGIEFSDYEIHNEDQYAEECIVCTDKERIILFLQRNNSNVKN